MPVGKDFALLKLLTHPVRLSALKSTATGALAYNVVYTAGQAAHAAGSFRLLVKRGQKWVFPNMYIS